eukprot:5503424-Prymnesium_polylepis.1
MRLSPRKVARSAESDKLLHCHLRSGGAVARTSELSRALGLSAPVRCRSSALQQCLRSPACCNCRARFRIGSHICVVV